MTIRDLKNIVCVTIVSYCMGLNLCAQDRIPANIPTPGASSICRYGAIPMSYYIGTPNITIPLHKFNCRDVELPVYLSYDASGVRLNQLPSWTGENWTLHAGGCITRTINGYPDELVSPQAVQIPAIFHNYFESYYKMPYYLDNRIDELSSAIENEDEEFWDLEPDVFHFNFMGHRGAFFLGNDGEWKVVGDEDFDVIFDVSDYSSHLIDPFIKDFPCKEFGNNVGSQPKVIEGFKLRDTNGTTYEFGFSPSAIEYSTPLVQSSYEKIISWNAISWYLHRVTDRFGNELYTLNYNRGKFIVNIVQSYYSDSFNEETVAPAIPHDLYSSDNYEISSNNAFPYTGELEAPVYLNQICASDGTFALLTSQEDGPKSTDLYPTMHNSAAYAAWRSASGINIEVDDWKCIYYLQTSRRDVSPYQYEPIESPLNKTDSVLCRTRMRVLRSITFGNAFSGSKNYAFNYNTDSARMHLISLTERNRGVSESYVNDRKYEFCYDNYHLLPRNYVSNKTDHWGYCRVAATSHESGLPGEFIPMTSHDKAIYWQMKNPDQNCVKYGTLTKIIYPTGGACMIEYESNTFNSYLNPERTAMIDSTGLGGGVRVKSISEYGDIACSQLLTKRTFTYSGGELFCKPIYYWPNWVSRELVSGSMVVSSFRLCSIVPLSNNFGPSVGYSTVTETRLDGAKIIRHFRNLSNAAHDELHPSFNGPNPSPFDRFSEHGYMRGRLIKEDFYNKNDTKIRSVSYFYYGNQNNNTEYVSACSVRMLWGMSNAGYKGRIYKLFYPRYYVRMVTDSIQDAIVPSVIRTITTKTYHDVSLMTPYIHKQRICQLDEIKKLRGINLQNTLDNNKSTSIIHASIADSLARMSFYFPEIAHRHYYNGRLIGGDTIGFKPLLINGSIERVPSLAFSISPQGQKDLSVIYNDYTSTGRIRRVSTKGNDSKLYYWGNNDNLLIASSVGPQGPTIAIPENVTFDLNAAREFAWSLIQPANTVFYYTPLGIYTFYVYDRIGNLIATVNTDGTVTKYQRDRTWRITDILDTYDRTLRHFEYNYFLK